MSYFTIPDMCRAGRTTPRGLRFWEEKGLLGRVSRDDLDRRVFTQEQIDRAKVIAACQFGAMPIDEIKVVLDAYNSGEIRPLLVNVLKDLREEIAHREKELPSALGLEYDL